MESGNKGIKWAQYSVGGLPTPLESDLPLHGLWPCTLLTEITAAGCNGVISLTDLFVVVLTSTYILLWHWALHNKTKRAATRLINMTFVVCVFLDFFLGPVLDTRFPRTTGHCLQSGGYHFSSLQVLTATHSQKHFFEYLLWVSNCARYFTMSIFFCFPNLSISI